MLYVTGDTHGNINRFSAKELRKLKKGDTLFVCGDFGFIWDNSPQEKKNLKKLSSKKYTICFIDGTHENFDLLKEYKLGTYKGGLARNLMLNSNYRDCYLPYVTGIKTGTTDDAGKCIVTKASKNGYNYIAIIMGAKLSDAKIGEVAENIAFIECKKMIEWTFANIKYKVVAKENDIITIVDVKYSWSAKTVELVAAQDVSALVPANLDPSGVYIKPNTDTPKEIKAPIKAGDKVGTATVYYAGKEIATVDLVASKNVSRSLILAIGGLLSAAWDSAIGKIIFILIFAVAGGYAGLVIYVKRKKGKRKRR